MGQTALFEFDAVPNSPKPHQQAVDGWTRLWRETRGEDWAWSPIDLRRVRDCLKFRANGDPAVFLDRARRLLMDAPTVWLAQNASPAVLYSHWNSLTVTVKPMTRDQKNTLGLARAALEL